MAIVLLAAGTMGVLIGVALALLLPARIAAAARAALSDRLEAVDRGQERIDRAVRDELGKNREESAAAAGLLRDELRGAQKVATDAAVGQLGLFGQRLDGLAKGLDARLAVLTESNEKRLDGLRATVDERLKALQEDNAKRLDQMRQTVDEKLQGTLEKRLNDSFKLVSERLEAVQRGLGEMQTLAAGVGDLKKVLTNVKTRGTWGEVQLGALLEQTAERLDGISVCHDRTRTYSHPTTCWNCAPGKHRTLRNTPPDRLTRQKEALFSAWRGAHVALRRS